MINVPSNNYRALLKYVELICFDVVVTTPSHYALTEEKKLKMIAEKFHSSILKLIAVGMYPLSINV